MSRGELRELQTLFVGDELRTPNAERRFRARVDVELAELGREAHRDVFIDTELDWRPAHER